MLVKTFGSAVYGVEAITITVEVNVSNGQNYFIVGLPDNAVKESMQRIESAIKTNNYYMPRTKVVVNLAPADIKKSGSSFDLPIAIGVLGASDQVEERAIEQIYNDGRIKFGWKYSIDQRGLAYCYSGTQRRFQRSDRAES